MKLITLCSLFLTSQICVGIRYEELERRQHVVDGEDVVLECELAEKARRSGALKVKPHLPVVWLQWTRNGAEIARYEKTEKSAQWWVSDPRMVLNRGTYSLKINKAKLRDSATYQCDVEFEDSDYYDQHLEYLRLEVIQLPTAPGRPEVTSFTSRTLSISWPGSRVHRDAPIFRYILTLCEGEGVCETNLREIERDGNWTNALVSSLKPYTVYNVRVRGENIAGLGPYSPPSHPIRTKGEKPVGSPKIKFLYNATNNSVVMTWEKPPNHTLNGPLVGYRIMAHKLRSGELTEFYVNKPHVTSYEMRDLDVYTKYMISLEADNNFGYSPADTTILLTDQGVPTTAPLMTSVKGSSSTSVSVRWSRPPTPNGIITHYTLFHTHTPTALTTNTLLHHLPRDQTVFKHQITNLNPFEKYLVWVVASTVKGDSPSSDVKSVMTDTSAPSAPRITNITFEEPATVVVEWSQPVSYFGQLDNYKVELFESPDASFAFKTINTTLLRTSIQWIIPDKSYFVTVTAATRSILNEHLQFNGPPSERQAFILRESKRSEKGILYTFSTSACQSSFSTRTWKLHCDVSLRKGVEEGGGGRGGELGVEEGGGGRGGELGVEEGGGGRGGELGVLLTLAGVLSVAMVLCFFFLLWRRYRRKGDLWRRGFSYIETQEDTQGEMHEDDDHPSVPVGFFEGHVDKLSADGNAGFAKEFEDLEAVSMEREKEEEVTCVEASLPDNKTKNRYVNILAYDQSRVVLRTGTKTEGSVGGYINANYVDGFRKPRAYIATQGPLPSTFGDFWRMIWEQRTLVIVMITNVVEKGRKKCDQYWPSEGTEVYGGQFQVRLLNQYSTAFYSVRMFTIKNVKASPLGAERVVFQYHYTHWPDHGVPPSPLPVLTFIRKSIASNRDGSGPIVVHCSAGVGRSGTYVVIESMLRQLDVKSTINIYGFLQHIRMQRNFLVQTEDQYVFCHEALLEAIRSGKTEISTTDLPVYVSTLLPQEDMLTGNSLLQLQYQNLKRMSGTESLESGRKYCNSLRNRCGALLPVEEFRVKLSVIPGVQGSDYINATFLPGFQKMNEFIVTHSPTDDTKDSFWRMIWEHNCQTVVVLCEIDGSEGYPEFWPNSSCPKRQFLGCPFLVYFQQHSSDVSNGWECYDFILQSTHDEFQLPCRLLYHPAWSQLGRLHHERSALTASLYSNSNLNTQKLASPVTQDNNNDEYNVWDLVHAVQDWHLEYQNGPITIVDQFGGTVGAWFCALTTSLHQIEQESSVDLYQTAKLYHSRRPGIFSSLEEYGVLYKWVVTELSVGESEEKDSGFSSRFRLSSSLPNGLPRHNDAHVIRSYAAPLSHSVYVDKNAALNYDPTTTL